MDKRIIFGLSLVLIGLLLFGCTRIGDDSAAFVLDQNFSLKEGQSLRGAYTPLSITLVKINDSRCPADVMCIWQGELGATITVSRTDAELAPQEIYLGLFNKKKTEIFGYNISLVDVNVDANTATFIVTKIDDEPTSETEWFSISPKQCNSNEWDVWFDDVNAQIIDYYEAYMPGGVVVVRYPDVSTNTAIVTTWLAEEKGILVALRASREFTDFYACEACSCPTGEEIAVLVDTIFESQMLSLGFEKMGPIACTMDAKICSDGSAVGRTAPFCEFETCPIVSNNSEQVLIVKTNYPGFVINPVTITTTITSTGDYNVETTEVYRGENTDINNYIRFGKLTSEELTELLTYINSSNFFSITETDAQMCIADIPTIGLDVTIGVKQNIVNNIGAECDSTKVESAININKKIDELTKVEASTSTSGIIGTVLIGPTCPVVQDPPTDECADKPYKTSFIIYKSGDIKVTEFSSDAEGKFKLDLSPGTYKIGSKNTSTMPSFSPVEITVIKDNYTIATLSFDSGIR